MPTIKQIFSQQTTNNMECQGECNKLNQCLGQVKEVLVAGGFCPDGMVFNYCEAAIKEDERRGFTVDVKDREEAEQPRTCYCQKSRVFIPSCEWCK